MLIKINNLLIYRRITLWQIIHPREPQIKRISANGFKIKQEAMQLIWEPNCLFQPVGAQQAKKSKRGIIAHTNILLHKNAKVWHHTSHLSALPGTFTQFTTIHSNFSSTTMCNYRLKKIVLRPRGSGGAKLRINTMWFCIQLQQHTESSN